MKNEGTGKHEGLEKLMLKIGVFSSLYLVSHFSSCQLLGMNQMITWGIQYTYTVYLYNISYIGTLDRLLHSNAPVSYN